MRQRLLLLALVLATAGATMAQPLLEHAARNVRMTVASVFEGDTIEWRVQWTAPQRPRLGGAITGYTVQWIQRPGPIDTTSEAQVLVASQAVSAAPPLHLDRAIHHNCETTPTAHYRARVKARGAWDPAQVPWGWSDETVIECGGLPLGPPTVGLDTIGVDTLPLDRDPEPADHAELAIVETGPYVTWDPDARTLHASVLWGSARGCILSYRDGVWYRRAAVPAAYLTGDGIDTHAVPGSEWSCWDVVITAPDGGTGRIVPHAEEPDR